MTDNIKSVQSIKKGKYYIIKFIGTTDINTWEDLAETTDPPTTQFKIGTKFRANRNGTSDDGDGYVELSERDDDPDLEHPKDLFIKIRTRSVVPLLLFLYDFL